MKAKNDSAGEPDEGDSADPASVDPASVDPELGRGRQQLVAILFTLGGSSVTLALLGGLPLRGMFVQLVVLALLAAQLFRGIAWARWVLAALTGLGAAGNVYMAIASLGGDGVGWIVNIGLAVIYAWCAFVLALSPVVTLFMTAQRTAREAAES